MPNRLMRLFVPEGASPEDPGVRERCGVLSGRVGLGLNLLLFAVKLLAGILTGAISVLADAFNNLSDAASSVVTIVGFRLAGQEADADHPFGHGRMEYLTGLVVSILILVVGVELGKSSVEKILRPEETRLTLLTGIILAASVLVKVGMGLLNRALSRRIGSDALAATSADSWSDAVATSVVLAGLVVTHFTGLRLDGWLGLLVAVFILRAGFLAVKDTLDPLLGKPPEPDTVRRIEEVILSHRQVVGIHDLIIHDYGPGRRMMSVHAEVAADAQLLEVHDVIDHIERELHRRFHIETVIHIDPIQIGNPEVDALRDLAGRLARTIAPELTIHDFRMTAGPTRTTLVFDVVVPYGLDIRGDEVKARLSRLIKAEDETYRAIINVDYTHVL